MRNQTHPQNLKDSGTLASIPFSDPNDLHKCELARLLIRYEGFPGAERTKQGLASRLEGWGITKEQLFEQTRKIHAEAVVYRHIRSRRDDWS